MTKLNISIFLILSLRVLSTQSECLNNSTVLKVRIFEDLLELQGNKNPFTVDALNYLGNDVIFKDNILVIPKNAFVTYDSNNIQRIDFSGKQVRKIENGAFYQLDCLIALNLSNNKITSITKRMFEGLEFLHVLDISTNLLEDIPEEVFTHVPRLRILSLADNKLHVLKVDSFFKLWLLEELDLSNNYLANVPGETLQYFRSLTNLQLGSNLLDDLGLDRWKEANELKILNVSNNFLDSFDMSVKYSFRRTLTELYLDRNYLTKFYTTNLKKRFPALKVVDINDNFWSCFDLFSIVKKLNTSGIGHPSKNTEAQHNIAKIACDTPKIVKEKKTWNPSSIPHATFNITNNKTVEELKFSTPELVNSVSTLGAVLIGFLLLAIIYIVAIISIKTQCYRGCRRRRLFTEVEHFPLSPGRYQNYA